MADLINLDGLLVSREKVAYGYAPIKIAFRHPITDESMRSLAAFAYTIEKGGNVPMWEDTFQVYKRYGENRQGETLVASDMSIRDAMLFVVAWFDENFATHEISLEIRRQPKEED